MSKELTEKERISVRTGLPEGVIDIARGQFAQMKKILVAVMEMEIESKHSTMETCKVEEILTIRDQISGLRVAIARINEQ